MGKETALREQTYFRFDDTENTTVDMIINICGDQVLKHKFQTKMDVGRKDYYLMYILSGKMDAVINGKRGVLEGGTAVCISPYTPYFYMPTDGSSDCISYRFVHFTGKNVDSVLKACNIPVNEIFGVDINEEIYSLWDDLYYEFRNNFESFDTLGAIFLPYMLMKIGKMARNRNSSGRKLDLSIRYIHANISSPLSIEELAAMEFLSVSRYREVFRNVTGYSPIEYISALRIRLAAKLLSQGDASIEEVSHAVGYSDRLYFQRVFKKNMGVTPGGYLKAFVKD